MTPAGFPHSDISGSTSARDSPELFAACRVLHRLLAPRHPPRALCSLTTTATHQAVSCRVARDAPCTQLGEIEDLQSAETYPVVKVGPYGLGRATLAGCPAIRWSVSWFGSRIRGAMEIQTPIGDSSSPSRRFAALASRSRWGVWPRYSVRLPMPGGSVRSSRWWRRGDSNS